jgi:hypothetical protein
MGPNPCCPIIKIGCNGKTGFSWKKTLRKLGFNRILHESTLRYEDLKLISTNAPG